MVAALVLSGGGSHGAFQVGAVRYLYTHASLRPEIICGTSVGSINGLKLAEAGPNTSNHTAVLDDLLAIWRSMQDDQDLWNLTPFMKQSPALTKILMDLMADKGPDPFVFPDIPNISGMDLITGRAGVLVAQLYTVLLDAALRDAALVLELTRFLEANEQSVLNLDPIIELLQARINPAEVAKSGTELRLASVSLESGTVRYVTEDGRLLERDNRTPTIPLVSPSVPTSCDNEKQALDAATVAWQDAQRELAAASSAEKQAAGQAVRDAYEKMLEAHGALDTCLAQGSPPPPPPPAVVDVRIGALASASIPVAFPPVEMFGEHYVDGGVRELLPVHVAAQLGADDIYAIPSSALIAPYQKGSFAKMPWSSIALRSAELIYDEVARDEEILEIELIRRGASLESPLYLHAGTYPGAGWLSPHESPTPVKGSAKVSLIEPWTDFYGITEVIPQLIEAEFAYGWMRAYEVVHAVPANQSNSDDIVRHLVRLYELAGGGNTAAVHDSLLDEVARRTIDLGAESLPPEAASW